ncbi:hypothetical protein BC829DRAFT_417656 [Chytridium lagenaria]|nr:hypothetical protein BC829DRAFT_417656 [Chytridium lagenaria]
MKSEKSFEQAAIQNCKLKMDGGMQDDSDPIIRNDEGPTTPIRPPSTRKLVLSNRTKSVLVWKFQEEHEESKVSRRKFAERHNVDHTALKRWEDNIEAIELQANQKKKYVRKPAKRKGEEEGIVKFMLEFVQAKINLRDCFNSVVVAMYVALNFPDFLKISRKPHQRNDESENLILIEKGPPREKNHPRCANG